MAGLLAIAGAAVAAYFFLQPATEDPGSAGGAQADWSRRASLPYLIAGRSWTSIPLQVEETTHVRFAAASSDARPLEWTFLSDNAYNAALAGESQATEAAVLDPDVSRRLEPGLHHLALVCAADRACRGTVTVYVAKGAEVSVGAVERAFQETTVFEEEDGEALLADSGSHRTDMVVLQNWTSLEFEARETAGRNITAYLLRASDIGGLAEGKLGVWAATAGSGIVANGTTHEAGRYILAVRCDDWTAPCRVAVTLRAVHLDRIEAPTVPSMALVAVGLEHMELDANDRLRLGELSFEDERVVLVRFQADNAGGRPLLQLVPAASYVGNERVPTYEDAIVFSSVGPGIDWAVVPPGTWQILAECEGTAPCAYSIRLLYWLDP